MNLHEQYLERLVHCPIMDPEPPTQLETAGRELSAWALRQSFQGKLVGKPEEVLHDIRGRVLEYISDGTKARRIAYRLFKLLLEFEVVHLEQPYNLIVAGYTIQGEYALLRSRKGECIPHVLIVHPEEPSQRNFHAMPPDTVSLLRLLHARTNTKFSNARLLHYALTSAKYWIVKDLNTGLARKYVEDIIKVAALRPQFPSIGEHCRRCRSKPCLGVFNGQDDNSRTGR